MTYEIFLKNCAFFGRHGVLAEEEVLGQRFYVDALLTVRDGGALESDAVEATVDYGEVFAEIERLVTGERTRLIEALALRIARRLRRRFPAILRAAITVRKPGAPVAGVLDHVEVTVVDEG